MWLVLFLAVITGSFVEIAIIFCLIFIHEMGHIGMALFFRWRISSIMFWPFGGVMNTDEYYTRSYKEEFLVVLAGPMQHIWIHFVLMFMLTNTDIPTHLVEYALTYNTNLLLFNLLPIYPLDGGKILLLLLSYKVPFKQVISLTVILSIAFIMMAMFITYFNEWSTFHTILLACFLLLENRLEWKRRQYIFIRHLMSRYAQSSPPLMKKLTVSPSMTVYSVLEKFYKGKYHHVDVLESNQLLAMVGEQRCLEAFFDQKLPHTEMRQLAETGHT
ncbi:stage IV sporulation protein FB [Salinibacillus xinjiangensis]|uniref:Stage IV sporulation protein FB n=1 Tax=Salinibacillus xinjiangensis TaxID=1229268 RepID=A0A6G1XBA9_9BACI|nr:stage IV sporulation protein FB [Salinibacillus xinjiangensis]